MKQFPKKLQSKLDKRQELDAYRKLSSQNNLVDFSSNDYLGFSKSESIFNSTHQFLIDEQIIQNGSTGSRLLNGNHQLYDKTESLLCEFHNSEAALIFNSGYDANLGFFASVPHKGDFIFYDELCHASIRDGIQLSHAKAYKFKHNDLDHLKKVLNLRLSNRQENQCDNNTYIVTESVFSMDGDSPNLKALSELCTQYNAHLIIDEAHAIGVFGNGKGLIQELKLEDQVFARLITFGKALGCHGAAILGNNQLRNYLINFARSFIYTTALPPHSLATIITSYNKLQKDLSTNKIHDTISFFKSRIKQYNLNHLFINSDSAIQCAIISGNVKVKSIATELQKNGFDVKPILSPTVHENKERLRFCLHSYNSEKEITKVLELLATFTTKD